MKIIILILISWVAPNISFAAPQSLKSNPLLKGIAAIKFEELHVVEFGVNANKRLRLATWCEVVDKIPIVSVVIFSYKNKLLNVIWNKDIQDAYEPTVNFITNWRYGKHSVLALTYRQGAEAQQLEIYGLNENNELLLLDKRLGEEIEWRVGTSGEAVLSVYTKPDGHLVPSCYRWRKETNKLESLSCP